MEMEKLDILMEDQNTKTLNYVYEFSLFSFLISIPSSPQQKMKINK